MTRSRRMKGKLIVIISNKIVRGLLGGHTSCLYLQSRGKLTWYSNELLLLAVNLADRFLPAFDTPTGDFHGIVRVPLSQSLWSGCFWFKLHA